MANPTKRTPLSLLFIAMALTSAADSARFLNQVNPLVGPTSTISPIGPGPTKPPALAGPTPPIGPGPNTSLSFFMHDILGGSHPSVRVVTGIVRSPEKTALPFSQPKNNVFPLAGGEIPAKSTRRRLIFGSVTAIDVELTDGDELGSGVIGRAEGFYLASSSDGSSHTIALTAMIRDGEDDGEVEDTINLFGVHRTASFESVIAVVGGTGKYEKARGYAVIKSVENKENNHLTDGVDTVVHFSVFLS